MIDALEYFFLLLSRRVDTKYLKTVIAQDPPGAGELHMYFDHTYVGVSFMTDSAASFMSSGDLMHLRMRHVPPMYALHLRNVHDAIITIFEKWNKFFHFVGHYHPSVWHMIEWFGREEATARTIIQQAARG